jgi:hypothetical protein
MAKRGKTQRVMMQVLVVTLAASDRGKGHLSSRKR